MIINQAQQFNAYRDALISKILTEHLFTMHPNSRNTHNYLFGSQQHCSFHPQMMIAYQITLSFINSLIWMITNRQYKLELHICHCSMNKQSKYTSSTRMFSYSTMNYVSLVISNLITT